MAQDPIVSCLLPALYILDKNGKIQLSEESRGVAKNRYLRNKSRWMMSEYRLKPILDLFCQAGIDVIPLKGAILQSLLYRDSGIRSLADVDILVHSDEFLCAANLLVQSGLALVKNNLTLAELEKLPPAHLPGELSFYDRNGFGIDLHRNLLPSQWFSKVYSVETGAVWERSVRLFPEEQAARAGGAGLWKRILSPYDLLAHLCLHSALHGLQLLKSYLDIDLWVRNLPPTWEWSRFIEITSQWQIRSAVFHVMIICRDFMETPVPDHVLKQLDPGWLARWRVRQLISPKTLLTGRSSLGTRYPTLVKLSLADHVSIIFLTVLKLVFPDKSMYTRHPVQKGILGHWLHIFDVIKRGD
ncbi:MAG TPA: nucleotidyltransferase family protein [Anaerolineales bacterium]|nr:nucleotidyltransferase family protein [Anaerolineales bacterium]